MTPLAVIVPTVGRSILVDLLDALAEQIAPGDRVMVMCDNRPRYDFCADTVANYAGLADGTWRCYPPHDGPLGAYGHPQRNRALDLLDELEERPQWAWSIDDDDTPTFGALDFIRSALDSEEAPWYVFRMIGGPRSHFPDIVVPTQGETIRPGNVGTPMLVFPLCAARFGTGPLTETEHATIHVHARDAGYFGDYTMAAALQRELGAPGWRNETVAEIRPGSDRTPDAAL